MVWTVIANLRGVRGYTGAQGLPGTGAAAADAAVAGYLGTAGTSETKTAADANYLRLNAQLNIDPNAATMRTWNAAVAASRTTRANVLILGDSISEGQGADAYFDGYHHQLNKQMQTVYGGSTGGEGFVPSVRGFTGSGGGDAWVYTGSPDIIRGETNISGLGRRALSIRSGESATHTFYGDRFQLMFTGWTTAPDAKITIDGGAPVYVPTNSVEGVVSGIAWTSPALARGEHTVKVETDAPTITLDGGTFWDGDYAKGITVWDASHAGFRADHFDGHDAESLRWTGGLGTAAPDLVIIALGTNDEKLPDSATYSPEIFGARLGTIIDLIRTHASPSFAFLLQPTPGTGGGDARWLLHRAAILAVAVEKGAAVIDLKGRIPSGPASGSTSLYFNSNHPNSAGYRAYARVIAEQMGLGAPAIRYASGSTFNNTDTITVTNTSAATYVGPEVSTTVEVPASGRVLITLSARIANSSASLAGWLGYTASGANTVAASASKSIRQYGTLGSTTALPILVGGLTPGVTKFSAVAWVNSANTGTYESVSIVADPR